MGWLHGCSVVEKSLEKVANYVPAGSESGNRNGEERQVQRTGLDHGGFEFHTREWASIWVALEPLAACSEPRGTRPEHSERRQLNFQDVPSKSKSRLAENFDLVFPLSSLLLSKSEAGASFPAHSLLTPSNHSRVWSHHSRAPATVTLGEHHKGPKCGLPTSAMCSRVRGVLFHSTRYGRG